MGAVRNYPKFIEDVFDELPDRPAANSAEIEMSYLRILDDPAVDSLQKANALKAIVMSYFRITMSIASVRFRYSHAMGISIQANELFGEAMKELLELIHRHHPHYGLVITYLRLQLGARLQRVVDVMIRPLRVPESYLKAMRELQIHSHGFRAIYGYEPSVKQLADLVEVSMERIHELRMARAVHAVPLHEPPFGHVGFRLEERLADPKAAQTICDFEARHDLFKLLDRLPERERDAVIRMDLRGESSPAIAREWNLTDARVRQIRRQGLELLQKLACTEMQSI